MRCSHFLPIVLLLSACGGGSTTSEPSGPFQFRTTEQVPVAIDVQKDGQPVAGASITLVEEYDPAVPDDDSAAEAQGRVFFEGGTSKDGRCATVASIPAEVDRVDVVVHHPGSRGPWTEETLRLRWGPFAPAARVTVRIADLRSLQIDLEER